MLGALRTPRGATLLNDLNLRVAAGRPTARGTLAALVHGRERTLDAVDGVHRLFARRAAECAHDAGRRVNVQPEPVAGRQRVAGNEESHCGSRV